MSFNDPNFVSIYERIDGLRDEDVPFYLEAAASAEQILDAGCGSGRLLIPLVRAGKQVTGFDASEAMLEVLRAKLTSEKLEATTFCSTLQALQPASSHSYDLIICSFNTFLHLLSQDDQLSVLGTFRQMLSPGGRLILDIINPTNFDIYDRQSSRRTFEATVHDKATGTATSIWRWFEHDAIEQRAIYHREFETRAPKGLEKLHSSIEFRWIYPTEMRLLFRLNGFDEHQVFGDFDRGPLTEDSMVQLWCAVVK